MKQITLNIEAFRKACGKQAYPLKGHEIDLVLSIAGVAADRGYNSFNDARRQWPLPPMQGTPNEVKKWKDEYKRTQPQSALEDWLLLYMREPRAVLYVMGVMASYIEGRTSLTKALAVRSGQRVKESHKSIWERLDLSPHTPKQQGRRLNRLAEDHAAATRHPLEIFAEACAGKAIAKGKRYTKKLPASIP